MSAAGAIPIEYLGHDRRRPRSRWWAVATLAVIVVGGVVPIWANAIVIDRANQQFGAAFARSQQQVDIGEREVLGTLAYSQPMIWSSQWPESTRAGLRAIVQDSAAAGAARLARTRDDVAGTLVLPWQSAQRAARQRLLELIDADLERFDRIAADARAISDVMAAPRPATAVVVDSLRASGAEALPNR